MRGMASSRCLTTGQEVGLFLGTSASALCSAKTSEGIPHSAPALTSWDTFKCENIRIWKFGVLFPTMSIAVHTEWQASAFHTEEWWGPNSGPPCPCPSGWAAPGRRCCPRSRAGCRSCCPETSSGSGRESPASRGRLASWPGWAAAGGQTPASWVSPGDWWEDPGRGWVERGPYAAGGLGRWRRGWGGEGCPGSPVYLIDGREKNGRYKSSSLYN